MKACEYPATTTNPLVVKNASDTLISLTATPMGSRA